MKKIFNKKVVFALIIVILLAVSAFIVWTQITYEAIDDSEIKLENNFSKENDWMIYGDKNSITGVILYPGAKVEPEAYGYLAQELAESNMLVAIPKVTLNLAIFDYSKADELIGEFNGVKNWIIGGHSMGGAAAAMYADKNMDQVQGLVLLGSFAAENETLANSSLPVLSISGSEDGLSTPEKIKQHKPYLPETAEYFEIKGGNHAQFGVYGEQSGDNEAEISVKEQQDIIVDKIEKWAEQHNWNK